MSRRSLSVEPKQFYENWKGGIVCIRVNGRLEGGGVFVQVGSRQLVLTAAHVVYQKKNLSVDCCDGRSFVVRIVHIKREFDLAWLQVVEGDTSGLQCLKLTDNQISNESYVHFIGHPRMARYTYNMGKVASSSRTCGNIYFGDLRMQRMPRFNQVPDPNFIDDFLGLRSDILLVRAKNVHGGGRVGGTGAPFLDSNGDIVGIYSFNYRESDYAIHSLGLLKHLVAACDFTSSPGIILCS
ncbi:hypothetical protein KSS87_019153 [Heliosperma pusillum]|nr:hypothetical protein KSS87_019153 [Heliosperma pusillum]